jgi:signal transduction histidine kinase
MPRQSGENDYRSLLRQQESLRAVIESISSELELRPLLTRIVRHACELLNAENGTIGLVDEELNLVRTEAAYRMPPDELGAEMPCGVGLAGQVLQTQRPLVLRRYGEVESPTQLPLLENAVIGIPIFWRGQMIGVFGLGSPPPRQFSDQDVEVLSLFAKHAAIAIENARLFARMQTALNEMQLLYDISRRIGTALDVEEVAAAYLGQVAARGRHACTIALYDFNEAGERTAVIVKGRWTPGEGMAIGDQRIVYTRDSLDPLLDEGQTVAIADVHTDPRVSEALRDLQRQSGRPALAFIPLMARGFRIGLVVLSSPTVHTWQDAELRPYQITAAQLAASIESRRQNLLVYERGQQIAVLQERHRLARELHDSVTQLLFSVMLIAQSVGRAWQRSPEEGERRIARLVELSQEALAEMRALLTELRPVEVADTVTGGLARVRQEGLESALRRHVANIARDGLEIEIQMPEYAGQPVEREEAIYRIVQEALNNIVKHSRARSVCIRLQRRKNALSLTIQDDGIGFEPETATYPSPSDSLRSGGMGLRTMRERAEALGGTFLIRSAPDQGASVEVTFPDVG